ncbi:MAG: SoxR reducing system RseC family protein [Candidatus Electryonea clarkiae]|nr:SoxR reducing system RseC family protein [Candidatus Electryonea clarkiae]MDP8288159.1 SoxR reducing system RseC family protein [Candidatus Electryonea clarkiae]
MVLSAVFGKGPDNVQETAKIISIDGKTAKAQLEVNNACGECGSKGFCHPSEGTKPTIEINNDIMANAGDMVSLEISPSSRIGSSFIVFGIPILMLVIGAISGETLGSSGQDSVVVGAIAGLAFGLVVVNIINRLMKQSIRIKPRAIKILSTTSN